MVFLIALAGGSGSGKSTLAYALKEKFPDIIEVVHFDDYQKQKGEVPVLHGLDNWDHSESINFIKLIKDLKNLKAGYEVTVMTKSEKYNPHYREIGRIPLVIKPRKIIIVEGYMSLVHKEVRELLDYSVFLDLHDEERVRRRTKLNNNPDYVQKVLLPMHREFVEPTQQFADLVIDIGKHTISETQILLLSKLKEKGFL